jgi:ABC-2 type transport system ATP-binding protein
MGLDHPSAGHVTVDGKSHSDLHWPLREVGGLLEAKALHPGRSARNHLLSLAVSNAIPSRRVDEVLDIVGLSDVANKRAGKFSLGMGQRLGIATALLGDPGVLLFDEPINGLDPEGIRWVRNLLGGLAKEGRTVFVSSHLMSEMALTATDLIVIGKGRLLAASTADEFIRSNTVTTFIVRSENQERLARVYTELGATVSRNEAGSLVVTGADSEDLGRAALSAQVAVYELRESRASLERVFMDMTESSVEYRGQSDGGPDV